MEEEVIELNEFQKMEIRAAFDLFDLDGDGKISIYEIRQLLRQIGQEPALEEIKAMLREALGKEVFKTDQQQLTQEDFIKLMEKRMGDTDTIAELIEAFKMLCNDNDKYISVKDLKDKMKELGETLSENELEEMIKVAAEKDQNYINYEAFVNNLFRTKPK